MANETDPLLLLLSKSSSSSSLQLQQPSGSNSADNTLRANDNDNDHSINNNHHSPNNNHNHHLYTYSAGEETRRLAALAKELGLEKQRKAKIQVRKYGFPETFQHQILPVLAGLPLDNHRNQSLSPQRRKQRQQRHNHIPTNANTNASTNGSANGSTNGSSTNTNTNTNTNPWETLAGVAGNVLEWYDFAIFGYFGDIIGDVFFPPQEGNAATMEAFVLFGGAFLMRPIGGFLLGYLGDVYGRKQALTTSIFLMAFPTFFMGCLPGYQTLGYLSTTLLVVTRLLQGMSVGGQLMSSLVFTLENVPQEQWGLYGSFVWATGNFGVLLGGLVGTALRANLTTDQLIAYGKYDYVMMQYTSSTCNGFFMPVSASVSAFAFL